MLSVLFGKLIHDIYAGEALTLVMTGVAFTGTDIKPVAVHPLVTDVSVYTLDAATVAVTELPDEALNDAEGAHVYVVPDPPVVEALNVVVPPAHNDAGDAPYVVG